MVKYRNTKRKPIISTWVKNHPKPASAIGAGLVLAGFGYYGHLTHPGGIESPAPITSRDTRPQRFGCDHLSLAQKDGHWLLTLTTEGPTPEGDLHMRFSANYRGDTPDIRNKVVDGLSAVLPLGDIVTVEGGVIDPSGKRHDCLPTRP